ncbi:hypothetical protein B0H13DRAFT_976360 [Mycena leptocephala]|jgi:hypothetical protein|nr:hypothetical protein B0H13DRAFT_976360 [Mycena leptocephala]
MFASSSAGLKALRVLARIFLPNSSTALHLARDAGVPARHPLLSILENMAAAYTRTVATGNSGTAGRNNPIDNASGPHQTRQSRGKGRRPTEQNSRLPLE